MEILNLRPSCLSLQSTETAAMLACVGFCVTQIGLELTAVILPLPPRCWDGGHHAWFVWCWDGTERFVHVRKTLYH